ncbi:MAG: hypothetical protein HY645_06930 [Acidobacteria bacterium]|nr:hypothetical protein [Acidobacteriota bacterium]
MGQPTQLTVRVLSCDAKIIGSLVGGCRITVRDFLRNRVISEGLHLGGSGDTEKIMKQPRERGRPVFCTEGTTSFITELELEEPMLVEVTAEGPLAYPQAVQKASATIWLFPGQHVKGDGLVLQLYGFIVDIMSPESVEILHCNDHVHLKAGVRLL